ncbi:hypothetical protein AtNW77_Chr2g0221351 [Arabidopsis thaliana]
MLYNNKHQRNQKSKTTNRFLVSINVLGSAGPIRFVVKEDETVSNVINYALKCYVPFDPWGKISSTGSRNFVLSNKLETQNLEDSMMTTTTRKTSGRWKAWLNKSFGLMVPSH